VQTYRLYLLDSVGRIHRPAIEIMAADDDSAVEQAAAHGESAMELWHRERLVQRLEARRREA